VGSFAATDKGRYLAPCVVPFDCTRGKCATCASCELQATSIANGDRLTSSSPTRTPVREHNTPNPVGRHGEEAKPESSCRHHLQQDVPTNTHTGPLLARSNEVMACDTPGPSQFLFAAGIDGVRTASPASPVHELNDTNGSSPVPKPTTQSHRCGANNQAV